MNPKVSIVIIGHNADVHYQSCLNSIFSQSFLDLEVIWVDSASTDDSLPRIRTQFPQVKIVSLATNAGYRRATNIGAQEALGEYLVICNQDTLADRYWLEQMIKCLEADDTIGIVAPKILMFADRQVINEAGNTLHYTGLYGSRGLGASATEYNVTGPIATMSGCCFLIRRKLWLEMGGFSEDFDALDTGWHASFEDMDLAWRSQLAGFKVMFCATALIYHKYESKGMIAPRFCAHEWGRYLAIIRNYDLRTIIILAPLLACLELGAWFYALQKGRPWLVAKARVFGWLITHVRQLARMHRRVQRMRQVKDIVILGRMSSTISLTHVMSNGRIFTILQNVVDMICRIYYHFLVAWLSSMESA